MRRLGELIEKSVPELAALETDDTGLPIAQTAQVLILRAARLKVGDPQAENTKLDAFIRRQRWEKVTGYIGLASHLRTQDIGKRIASPPASRRGSSSSTARMSGICASPLVASKHRARGR